MTKPSEESKSATEFLTSIIERDVPLSQSLVWALQRQLYLKGGVDLWRERPVFASASAFFSSVCADLVLVYLQERLQYINSREPIYLIELASGSGCFAYRFLRRFMREKVNFERLQELNIRFVMTDFIPEIVEVWRRSPHLKPFVDQGCLDFAVVDPSADMAFETVTFGWKCDGAFVNTPLFIANSLLDILRIDGFAIENGNACEITASVEADAAAPLSSLQNNELQLLQKVGRRITLPYYGNKDFDNVLGQYFDCIKRGTVSFPIGALEIIANLRKLTDDQFVLLCYSNGFTDLVYTEDSEGLVYSDLSFPLNFDALRRYFQLFGAALWGHADQVVSRCFALGLFLPASQCAELQETMLLFDANSDHEKKVLVGCADQMEGFLDSKRFMGSVRSATALLTSVLEASNCDPAVFSTAIINLLDHIEDELPTLSRSETETLTELLLIVDENIFAFDCELPATRTGQGLLSLLISVWQRAQAAYKQQTIDILTSGNAGLRCKRQL